MFYQILSLTPAVTINVLALPTLKEATLLTSVNAHSYLTSRKRIDTSSPAPRNRPQLALLKSSFVNSSASTCVRIKTDAPPKARRPKNHVPLPKR